MDEARDKIAAFEVPPPAPPAPAPPPATPPHQPPIDPNDPGPPPDSGLQPLRLPNLSDF